MSRRASDSSCDSYYSASGLPEECPVRRVRAANVRAQVEAAPPRKTSSSKYPEKFKNKEKKEYKSMLPLKRMPMLRSGFYTTGDPGALRAVYNNDDRATFDVMYHNELISKCDGENYDYASYRERCTGCEKCLNQEE